MVVASALTHTVKHSLRLIIVGGVLIYMFPDMPSTVLGAIGDGIGSFTSHLFSSMFGDLKRDIIQAIKDVIPGV